MSRVCPLSGKKVQYGNRVSHANNKTRRRFFPNLQRVSLMSSVFDSAIKMRLSTNAIRTIEKHGGIDSYIFSTPKSRLSEDMKRLRRVMERKAKYKGIDVSTLVEHVVSRS